MRWVIMVAVTVALAGCAQLLDESTSEVVPTCSSAFGPSDWGDGSGLRCRNQGSYGSAVTMPSCDGDMLLAVEGTMESGDLVVEARGLSQADDTGGSLLEAHTLEAPWNGTWQVPVDDGDHPFAQLDLDLQDFGGDIEAFLACPR